MKNSPTSKAEVDIRHKELNQLTRLAKKYMWDLPAQRVLQDRGVMTEPNRFYSQLPSLKDIETSFEHDPAHSDQGVWWTDNLFDLDRFRAEIKTLTPYGADFDPPLTGDSINPTQYFWNNPAFNKCDAMAYWCYIRRYRPENVVEIGSGFSSFIAAAALKANGKGRLTCIEPYPPKWLEENLTDIDLIKRPIQDFPTTEFDALFEDGDIIMIDSTHTVKLGSDCLWIYLKLLPSLSQDLYIHVHDISRPFAMSAERATEKRIHWTEMYLLMAYLLENPRVETLFSSRVCKRVLKAEGLELMGNKIPPGGGSFWFRQAGRVTKGDSFKSLR